MTNVLDVIRSIRYHRAIRATLPHVQRARARRRTAIMWSVRVTLLFLIGILAGIVLDLIWR